MTFRTRRLARFGHAVATVAVVAGIVTGPTLAGTGRMARADDTADARKHAQRASSLAASGKCRQAVAEFDKALAVLRDPALLFNRGECHRKLGDADAAIDDYKQFLSDLPKAPNRAEVERRIAELSKKGRASSGVPAAPAAGLAAPPAPGEPLVRAPASTSKREDGEPRASGSHAEPSVTRPARPAPPPQPAVAAEPEPAKVRDEVREVDLTAPATSTTSGTTEGTTLSSGADVKSEPAADGGLAAKPWFWVAVAAVAIGAGVGAFVLLSHDSTKVPSSALGNYQF